MDEISNVLRLPDDVVITIFTYFTHQELYEIISQVCQSWNHLAMNPVLWKTLKLCYKSSFKQSLKKISDRCTMLTSLSLSGFYALPESANIFKKWPKLKIFKLYDCDNLNSQLFNQLISYCPLVEKISVSRTRYFGKAMIFEVCGWPKLRSLSLSDLNYHFILRNNDVVSILPAFNEMSRLQIDLVGVSTEIMLNCIRTKGKNLKKLKLNCEHLEAGDVIQELMRCSVLRKLQLVNLNHLKAEELAITLSLPRLEILILNNCNAVNSTDLEIILENKINPSMKSLLFEKCQFVNNKSLKIISRSVPEIKNLNISNNGRLDDSGVFYLSENCRKITSMSFEKMKKITVDLFDNLEDDFPLLRQLSIIACDRVNHAALMNLRMRYVDRCVINR